ncbi:hypothetical protein [Flammeovirga kamogawensis]|uniref:Uncharacterized protein n=1 Tax=Flammeovirga kamogawensis TaxID=373891 RepID=A0ABX8GPT1_9BACT|nr:hypothetical protein [Flammeovirga kamogawensis]MBB6463454.1 hypothetical protein [Flammeovirga kamogawensis]QWG05620.1 hypothetical protein KM029_09510 [Flammeovirga kamogawensis]TRX67452.1 hypothetical protein EO216_04550 [Flammeovirga kamogawensis]
MNKNYIKKLNLLFFILVLTSLNKIIAQEIPKVKAGTKFSFDYDEWGNRPYLRVPYFPLAKRSPKLEELTSFYINAFVYKDSIIIFNEVNPFLYIVSAGEGYGLMSLNKRNEVVDLRSIAYILDPDYFELYTRVINDTTFKVTYLDGYRKRVEKYTLVQRDGMLVKKDSSFTEPIATFKEWEKFYIHYDRDKD